MTKSKDILEENDKVTIVPEENINSEYIKPQDIKIDIAYEDNDVIIINKKDKIICHPAAGHSEHNC